MAEKRQKRPKLVRLKAPIGDKAMADTLIFLLERVREGKVKAFSICLIIERQDGTDVRWKALRRTARICMNSNFLAA